MFLQSYNKSVKLKTGLSFLYQEVLSDYY